MFQEFINKNWFTLGGILITIVATWALNGARIAALEKQVNTNQTEITALKNYSITTQVILAQIQKDIEYIKLKVDQR